MSAPAPVDAVVRPARSRPRAPGPGRLVGPRPIQRSRGMPLVGRLALVARRRGRSASASCTSASGGLGVVAGGIGSTLGGFVAGVTATPSPTPSPSRSSATRRRSSSRRSRTPAEPTVDLVVTVPPAVAGDPDSPHPRLPRRSRTRRRPPIQEAPIAADARRRSSRSTLTKGINDFTVTIVGPGGESEPSPVVRYVLDQTPAEDHDHSPKNGAVVNGKAVDDQGQDPGPHRRSSPGTTPNGVVDRRHGRGGRHVHAEPGARDRHQRDPHHRHRPGRQRDRGPSAHRPPRVRQADRVARRIRPTRSARRTCRETVTLTADGHRPGRQAARRRRRHVHPEHPGHPDRHRRRQDRRERHGVVHDARSRRAPTPARAARPSSSRATSSARPRTTRSSRSTK